jgi:hypothetical protein
MTDDFLAALRAALPLRIDAVDWVEPTLTLGGPGWHLAATCPWRVGTDRVLEFGWESEDVQLRLPGLVGRTMVAVGPQSTTLAVDPSLQLDDGRRIELFSTHHLEPWSLRLPGMGWVASPSDPTWAAGQPTS